ncbi:iron ABC transporter permease [Modestobacter sp. VKM Ac-2979]|uniref:FecCD family ABC transporter permease n=1 Tax=unclassified Modestobacter TaxID=2643866 RepID=UPI0022AB51FB|nr:MULTISPECIES: iron ABC transporter permease [unclassified Modestobacter]MCZ2812012.1 iron ABC transporter permease [Modestobacter sp. VKM Ac-2979]MCZ2843736.1 iron ABC transporter permease [Modestobacter sp. VKM Ac-2980]
MSSTSTAPSPAADAGSTEFDDLGAATRRHRFTLLLAGLAAALAATVLLAVGLGAVSVPPGTVLRILGHHLTGADGATAWRAAEDSIVWRVRAPRVLLGVAVGAGLAVTGMALQAMVRNLLAEPYLLGVNSGASTGAAAAILFGFGAGWGEYALQGAAFLGALAASLLVFVVARSAGRITSTRLLMSGVAVGYALYALTSFLIFASDSAEGSRSVLFWLLGTLALARWSLPLLIALLVVVLVVAGLTLWGRQLDALAIGDDTAHTLGVAPARFRLLLLVLVSLAIGVLVSASGSIGFVGLVIPHLARRMVGATHRRAVPVAALIGAVFLLWADLAARTLLSPQELPIGIITSLVGAPFLLVLVRRMHAGSE